MSMTVLALLLLVAWLVIVGGARSYLQLRRTGDAGVSFNDRRGSPQWWARLISSLGLLAAFAAPVAEIAGLRPVRALDGLVVDVIGVGLVIVGIAVMLAGQWAMGASWRADVDESVRTTLVTTGPFRIVRNPILSATAMTAIGIALMVPNVFAALMLVAFLTAQQIQVRLVEEPYLLAVHGSAYRDYGRRTGRFLPWLGRFPSNQ